MSDIGQPQNGLKDLYVLRDSGECVYHKSYVKEIERLEADQTIMGSFLSAIETFSSNVDIGAKMLETTNNRFIYHKNGDYIYVARTEKSVNPEFITNKLGNISNVVQKWAPKTWNGDVRIFQGVSTLIQEQFYETKPLHFEITGKEIQNLDPLEKKVYAFLRFKGRATISTMARLMRIPEQDAEKVTQKMLKNKYLAVLS